MEFRMRRKVSLDSIVSNFTNKAELKSVLDVVLSRPFENYGTKLGKKSDLKSLAAPTQPESLICFRCVIFSLGEWGDGDAPPTLTNRTLMTEIGNAPLLDMARRAAEGSLFGM